MSQTTSQAPDGCVRQARFDPRREKHFEGAFTQGSGYFHLRGSYEEGLIGAPQDERYMRLPANVTVETPRHPLSKWGTYLPGVTGLHPLLREELVNLPYPAAFRVTANGVCLDMALPVIGEYERWLDLRDGVLYRRFVWTLPDGAVLRCAYKRFVSQTRKNLLVQEMQYTLTGGVCTLDMISDIDERVTTNGYNHFTELRKTAEENRISLELETDTGDRVTMAGLTASVQARFAPAERGVGATVRMAAGDTVGVVKLTALACSRDGETLPPRERRRGEALRAGDRREAEHRAEWARLWEPAAIAVEGDAEAQQALDFSLYHLLRSANRADDRVAVCAKGFAGEAYFGHFFWDTEVYLLPFFLHTHPEIAKNLCGFRLRTLPGARENARAYGCDGARYPWESSVSGAEQCPNWQYADHEVHVTADVVFGLWQYYAETGDDAFLKAAAPVFCETARYWLSRVERRPDGTVNLNGVMGPDEYVCFVNNNAYTNYMVSRSLAYTLWALELLRESDAPCYASLGVTPALLDEMRRAADALPRTADASGVIPQCDHFDELEEPDFDRVWPDRSLPYGRCVPQEKMYRTKSLKQADVLMLPYLFPAAFHDAQVAANYDYYLPYTTHDSSLSRIVHAILACRLGRDEEAWRFFREALSIDFDETVGGAAEGIHIANCGGLWQAVVFGFAGMSRSYESDRPQFSPRLPAGWDSVSFRICYGGNRYRVRVTKDGAKVTPDAGVSI